MGLLGNLKILDFTTLLPGPYATMMLADMGADVLRVESPTRADDIRLLSPRDGDASAAHRYLNRSKRSLALNLKRTGATAVIERLIADHDILVEQFRPGVMERLGLSYAALSAVNPALIYCSISGYGQNGPYRHRPGHDNNYLAIAGMASYSGLKDRGPLPAGFQVADVAGGSLHAIAGILAAVVHRHASGQGQHVDVSMTDAAFALNTISGANYLAAGELPELEGMMLNGGSFYGYYRCRDGRYFSVGSLEPKFLMALCQAIDEPKLSARAEALLGAESGDAAAAQEAFKSVLSKVFANFDFAEWCDVFAEVEACVEPVLNLAEAAAHPQLQARQMVAEVSGPDGSRKQPAHPIKYSGAQPVYQFTGCGLGEHSEEVLRSLGYSAREIDSLLSDSVSAKD